MNLVDKILLSNYSLSVLLCRKQKERYVEGACYLFSSELLYILCAIIVSILPLLPYHFSHIELLIILVISCLFSFYLIKKWLKYHITVKNGNIRKKYKDLRGKTIIYTLFGWIFFIGSFALMIIIMKYNFEGYSLPDYQP